jgi:hypothetical protein
MNRRGILGMLGMGAVAAPAVVHQYASDVVRSNIPSTGVEYKDQAVLWNPVEQLADARREYEYLTKDPAAWVADYVSREWKEYIDGYASYRYESIDPDIRSMKSLSETTKMRMYLERKARRKQQQYADSAMGRIQMLMKEV